MVLLTIYTEHHYPILLAQVLIHVCCTDGGVGAVSFIAMHETKGTRQASEVTPLIPERFVRMLDKLEQEYGPRK